MKKTIMAVFILLMAIAAVSAVSYSGCDSVLLKTGDSCTADTAEDIEGAMLNVYRGKDVHIMEIKDIDGNLIEFRDLKDAKTYIMPIDENNKVLFLGLGTIKISITETTLTAIDLKLKGR